MDVACRVLCVDDEKNVLSSLNRLLACEGFQVLTALSGREGLEHLERDPEIGVILSDHRMPQMTGVEFLSKARAIRPEASRILLTGYADLHVSLEAINSGEVYRFLSKPWDDEELVEVIRSAEKRYEELTRAGALLLSATEEKVRAQQETVLLKRRLQDQTRERGDYATELSQLQQQFKRRYMDMIRIISGLFELYDGGSRAHLSNVAALSLRVARAMRLADDDVERITIAALLHDIGKIGLPGPLLHRDPEELGPEDRRLYEAHPVRGQSVIEISGEMQNVGLLVRHHHETYGGNGFPDGLSGDNIPLGARIIGVADFLDHRVCHPTAPQQYEEAMRTLRTLPPYRFDTKLFRHFSKALPEVYRKHFPVACVGEWERDPADLQEGMILMRDVVSGEGILVFRKGVVLKQTHIRRIQRCYRFDPPKAGVFTWTSKSRG